MFINVEEYDVLQSPIAQSFEGCEGQSKATLFVRQRDTSVLFLKLKKKHAQVRCDLTGKVIKKSLWDAQTKAASIDLLAQHKVSKTGWYVMLLLLIGIPVAMVIGLSSEMKASKKLNESFSFQTDIEKKRILSTLGEGDFIKTHKSIYKIKNIDADNIILYKGGSVQNILDPINPEEKFDTSKEIKLNKDAFWKRITVSTKGEFGGDMIVEILDN